MSDGATLQPDQVISVAMSARDWNTVLSLLAEGPFRVAAPLIGEIQRQCTALLPQHRPGLGEIVQMRPDIIGEAGDG
jgi:hypothetical protein